MVTMQKMAFEPITLSIPAGATVIFQNTEAIAHEVVSTNCEIFNLKLQKPGQSASYTFKKAGAYEIDCDFHTEP